MLNIAAIYRLIPIKIFINKIFCAQMFQNFLNFPSVLNLWLRSLFILKDFLILLTFLNFIININIKEPFVYQFNLTCWCTINGHFMISISSIIYVILIAMPCCLMLGRIQCALTSTQHVRLRSFCYREPRLASRIVNKRFTFLPKSTDNFRNSGSLSRNQQKWS